MNTEFKKVSVAIKCQTNQERDKTLGHFIWLNYNVIGDKEGLVIFINPFSREVMTNSIQVAEDNFKDNGYNIVDFATFVTFIV